MAEKKESTKKTETATTPTPHNRAKKSEIAKTVIFPGDPDRAEWAANEFLEKPRLVTDIRGIKAFTGTYNRRPVTIMASGMGAPSSGLYSYELFNLYGVEKIIRTGTTGALQKNIKPGELIFAMSASTDSNYASQYELGGTFSPCADFELLRKAYDFAKEKGYGTHAGMVFSSDFYSAYNAKKERAWKPWAQMGALGQEMETYALYCNAAAAKKKALSILTVTINLHTRETVKHEAKVAAPMMLTALALV